MRWVIILIITILLVPNISAIGVGPASTKIDFEPLFERQYSINIYNTDNKSFTASLVLEGELNQYILLESQSVIFEKTDNQKAMYFNVSFPRDIPPGVYGGKLKIVESATDDTGTITTLVGIVHSISLEVPAHGKYIKTAIEETTNNIVLTITNIGLKTIGDMEVISEIYDNNEKFTYTDSTNNFQSDDIYTINMPNDYPLGQYKHDITINYDELIKTISRVLKIGEIEISIEEFNIESFTIGEIIKIDISVSSNWNQELNIRSEIEIMKAGESFTTISGENFFIKDEETIALFWTTIGVEDGEYKFIAKIFYNEKLVAEEIYDIEMVDAEPIKKSKLNLIIIGITLLIIIIVLLILFTNIKKNTEDKKKKK